MSKMISRRLLTMVWALLLAVGLTVTAFAAAEDTDPVRLSTPDASGNTAFAVENMFPGDAVSEEFTVRVRHDEPITLYYHGDIRPGSGKLAEVLMVKVELPEKGSVLYSGLMRDMPSALGHGMAVGETELIYRITVWLDTGVGNDYQRQRLIADFRWWYTEQAEAAAVKLTAEKVMDGRYPRGSEFEFLLKDGNGEILQRVNNRDGIVEFDTLTFEAEGMWRYTICENPGSDGKIDYDKGEYQAVITVTKEEGRLIGAVIYEKDGAADQVLPRFVNKTKGTAPPEEPDNPKMGDAANPRMYTALLGGSLLGLLLLLFLVKRKKEDREA